MTTRTKIRLVERRTRALAMRVSGASFRDIANELGLAGPGNAHRDVCAALADIVPVPAREALALELSRLDAIVAAIWPAVVNGELGACKVMLQCLARRAAYLGLDRPEHTIVRFPDDLSVVHSTDYEDDAAAYEAALAVVNEILGTPQSNDSSNDQAEQRFEPAQIHAGRANR